MLVSLLALFSSSASAASGRVYTGTSFGPNGIGGGTFSDVEGIAVDHASESVYVLDAASGTLYKFDTEGNPVNFASTGTNAVTGVGGAGPGENELAVAPTGSPGGTEGDIYVANYSPGGVSVYAPSGSKLGEFGPQESCGVAVDSTGNVFVGQYSHTIYRYTPTSNPVTTGDQTAVSTDALKLENEICNLAVDGSETLYAADYLGAFGVGRVEGIDASTSTLIKPGGPTLAVAPAQNELLVDRESTIIAYNGQGEKEYEFGSPILSGSRGIAVDPTTDEVFVANGTGQVAIFSATVSLPSATVEPASDVTEDSAVLHGTVNADGGPAATCVFEYVTAAEFRLNGFASATRTPCQPGGSITGSSPLAVSANLSKLYGDTQYHFRLMVASELGSNPSAAAMFSTESSSPPALISTDCPNEAIREAQQSTYLPDCRAYELVTPTEKGGAAVKTFVGTAGGDSGLIEGSPVLPGSLSGLSGYKVTRTAAGWRHSTDLYPSPIEAVSGPGSPESLVTPELDSAVVAVHANLRFTADAPVPMPTKVLPVKFGTSYIWHEGQPLQAMQIRPSDAELEELASEGRPFETTVLGASSDLTRIIFDAPGALAPGAPKASAAGGSVFEWHEGQIQLMGILPNDEPGSGSAVGSAGDPKVASYGSGYGAGILNAVSVGEEGSRIYFNSPVPVGQGAAPTGQLYLRINDSRTVEVSASQAAAPDPHGGPFPARFRFATPGGGTVFFSSPATLTDDANTGTEPITVGNERERTNLYRYEVGSGLLTDLTVATGPENVARGAAFGDIVAASTDGSTFYFTAQGILDPGHGVPGARNLYVYHDGNVHFVAKNIDLENYAASPDGRFLAIGTNTPLTEYDNTSPSGDRVAEIYIYSLESGGTSCASCPQGQATSEAFLPVGGGVQPLLQSLPNRDIVTNSGSVFFESPEALLPGTSRTDPGESFRSGLKFYEWQEGALGRIGPGQSDGEAEIGALSSGATNVFFGTYQQLLPEDTDDSRDIYDARVDGGFAEAPPAVECALGSCRASGSSSPAGSSPGSTDFSGRGNDGRPCTQLGRQAKRAASKSKSARRHGEMKKANRLAGKARRLRRESKACTRLGGAK
jgi:DNA-binding beta-propeller fold protein YncE